MDLEPSQLVAYILRLFSLGGQLFWPRTPVPFTVCLGPASAGDDIKPEDDGSRHPCRYEVVAFKSLQDMRAFHVPQGKGIYIHPGTWPPRLKIDWRIGFVSVALWWQASHCIVLSLHTHTQTHTHTHAHTRTYTCTRLDPVRPGGLPTQYDAYQVARLL